MNKEEIWKDIDGYEGVYQVSTHGQVKSVSRKRLSDPGVLKERIRVLTTGTDGYIKVKLFKLGKHRNYRVHRLVMVAFGGVAEGKPIVSHRDGNKLDNSVGNLEWVDQTRGQTGRVYANGESHGGAKLDWTKVREIREHYGSRKRYTQSKLAEMYQVNNATINKIISNKTWRVNDEKGK